MSYSYGYNLVELKQIIVDRKVVVRDIDALREIAAAFRGKMDFDNISKILNDFSNDLLIYFKSLVMAFAL